MKRDSGSPTKEKLIEAAIELFSEQGFQATPVQAIVEAAGATKGAFYHHFGSKDDVLVAIHERVVERDLAALQAIVDEGLSAAETLGKIIEEVTAAHDQYGREMRIMSRERHYLTGDAFAPIRDRREEVEHLIVQVIEKGVDAGEFKSLPSVRLAAFGVIGITAWLYQWYVPGGPMRAREIGRMYASMLLDGMKTRGSSRRS